MLLYVIWNLTQYAHFICKIVDLRSSYIMTTYLEMLLGKAKAPLFMAI